MRSLLLAERARSNNQVDFVVNENRWYYLAVRVLVFAVQTNARCCYDA